MSIAPFDRSRRGGHFSYKAHLKQSINGYAWVDWKMTVKIFYAATLNRFLEPFPSFLGRIWLPHISFEMSHWKSPLDITGKKNSEKMWNIRWDSPYMAYAYQIFPYTLAPDMHMCACVGCVHVYHSHYLRYLHTYTHYTL